MEKEMSSQQMVLGQLDIYIQKNEVIYLSIYLSHIFCKISKWDSSGGPVV